MIHSALDHVIVRTKGSQSVMRLNNALAYFRRNGDGQFDAHMSIARYGAELAEYAKAHDGSVKGYHGLAYADYWVGDVDRDTPDEALAAVRALAFCLHEHFDVALTQIRYSFSGGGTGYHLEIPSRLFGDVEPSPYTHLIHRRVAEAFVEASGVELDMHRYSRLALLRVLDTQYGDRPPAGKSYAWKTALTWEELSTSDVDAIDALARRPEPRRLSFRPPNLEPIDALVRVHDVAARSAAEWARRPPPKPVRERDDPIDVTTIVELLRPHYVDGQRRSLALGWGGYAAKQGVQRLDAIAVIRDVATNDVDGGAKSIQRVEDSYVTLAEGHEIAGYSLLREVLPDDVLGELARSTESADNHHSVDTTHIAKPTLPILPRLPGEFWETRPVLQRIRQAAHARNRSADAVLHCVLARAAAFSSSVARVDTGIGAPACLNYAHAIAGPSGSGKTACYHIARRLLPAAESYDLPDPMPIGTGQGIAAAFLAPEAQSNGKPGKLLVQIRHHAIFYCDEGAQINAEITRPNSILSEGMRRGWSGETLGQFNAELERRRVVRDYSLSFVIGYQPETVLPLLAEGAVGTPQRFTFSTSIDSSIPDQRPPEPEPLELRVYGRITNYGVDAAICAELHRDDTARNRGQLVRAPLDEHEPLHRIKLATLLALLDGRYDVTMEDWKLAGAIWETSCACRNLLVDYGSTLARWRERDERRRHVHQTVAADRAIKREEVEVERVAKVIARAVRRRDERVTQRDALKSTKSGPDRRQARRALGFAIQRGWIVETEDGQLEAGDVEG